MTRQARLIAEGLGLLRGVRVVRAGVDLQLGEELTAEDALREHALDRLGDRQGGLAVEEFFVGLDAEAAGLAAVVVVVLLLELAAGEQDLVGVDDDDEVARVDVRRERSLVLAAEDRGNAAREAAERFALSV